MDVFVVKFVSISPQKISGSICSEIYFAGTNISIPFLNEEENSCLESKYAMNIKELRSEIDVLKKISKTLIVKNGEPCLQGMALKSLAAYAKEKGFLFALETYGTRPSVIKSLIESKLIDILILKAYFPLEDFWMRKINKGKLVANNLEIISDIKKTLSMLKTSNVKVLAKTYVVPEFLDKKAEVAKIAKEIKDIRNCVLELVPYNPLEGSKLHRVKADETTMHQLKQHINERYPNIIVKISN